VVLPGYNDISTGFVTGKLICVQIVDNLGFYMSTEELFRKDGYLRECKAKVIASSDNAFCVDQTVFYPNGGGQPGDSGYVLVDGVRHAIVDCHFVDGQHRHILEEGVLPPDIGQEVILTLDWERRYRLMRMHSCMHMLCASVPAGVTGGSINEDRARLDFDMQDVLDKDELTRELNKRVDENHILSLHWITDAELENNPDLVRTMSVGPPKNSSGMVRLVQFGTADLQPCGGTHVNSSGEIGKVRVKKIEKKGKHNRRVIVVFDDAE